MKFLKKVLIVGMLAPVLLAANVTLASAAPPPYDHKTWEYTLTHEEEYLNFGTIPFRLGYYDGNTDKGFGTDKLEHKHNVTDLNMVLWVMRNDREPYLGNDPESGDPNTTLHWEADVENLACASTPDVGDVCYSDPNASYHVLVGAETEIMDEYWYQPASVTGPDRANLVPEDVAVGIITTYCVGFFPRCPGDINQWTNSKAFLPTA